MENWILGILSVMFVAGYFYKAALHGQKKTMQDVWKQNKYEMAMAGIFLVGFLCRLLWIRTMPAGLNQDEASAGYDAFAILKHGMDRNGVSYPVHLIAWGSGQNIVYSWMVMPFIALFGLNEFTFRLPMAILGCLGIVAFYFLLKNLTGKKETLIGTAIFAITPWHVMKSRWGLESNVFPELILFFLVLFIIGLKKKDRKYYYGSFAILALSVYSYGPSYFFVPFFLGAILVYVVATKKINWKELIGPCVMLLVLVTPMMLFVMINTFDMEQIKIGFITIPKLYASRHTELASVFSEDFIGTFSRNMKASFDIILKGEDGLPWNSISTYGICYNFSLVFLIIGIVVSFAKTDWLKGRFFMNAWGVMAFLTMGIVEPNINRINIVWIPLVYYVAVGIMACVRQSKLIFKTVAVVYLAAFLMFSNKYFTTYQEDIGNYFFESFGDALEAAEEKNTDVVYITNEINAPYMLTLFYKQISPQEYRNTVTFSSQYTAFEQILSFGKYVFYIPENLDQPNAAYIVSNYYAAGLDRNVYDVTEFNHYSVVTLKNVG